MGLFKKIFRGKKKSKGEDAAAAAAPIGNPSFPSATASESKSGGQSGKGSVGLSPSGSLSPAGSNAQLNYNTTAARYNMNMNSMNATTSPRTIGDFGSPRSSTGPIDTDDEGIILPTTDNIEEFYERTRNQTQEELKMAYEMSKVRGSQEGLRIAYEMSKLSNANANSSGEHDNLNLSSSSPRLTSTELKQWDRNSSDQQQHRLHQQFATSPTSSGGSGLSPSKQRQNQQLEATPQPSQQQHPVYTMSSALPSQHQFKDLEDMNGSESDASSFNLSTDAEDSEYEGLKRDHMQYPPGNLNSLTARLSALDTSAIDTVGSMLSYTTDEDRKIFPNLPTDDEMTLGSLASSKADQPIIPSLLLQPMSNPLKQVTVPLRDIGHHSINANVNNESNQTTGTSDIDRSTENLNSVNSSNDSSSIIKTNNNIMHHPKALDPAWNFAADPANNQPTSTKSISRNKPGGTPRNFTSPVTKSKTTSASRNTEFVPNNNTGFGVKASAVASSNAEYSNDGFGSIRGVNSSAITSSNAEFSDGFGNIRSGTSVKLSASKKDSERKSKKNIPSVDDTGFADFGNFAEFGKFSSTANADKPDNDWAMDKEEKKDTSWEDHNHEFFNTRKNTKPGSPFGNDNIADVAWPVNDSSPSANNNTSRDDPFRAASDVGSSYISEASSAGFQSPQDRSLTELLEAAKSKRKDRRNYGNNRHASRVSSSSVNSAPAITSSYLRQHHNLGGKDQRDVSGEDKRYGSRTAQENSYSNTAFTGDRQGADGSTSLSDIISSLEATERTKRSEQIKSHRSMGDAGVVATARAAKERLRERRRREREVGNGRNNSDSDDSEGHKNSESWLFDQVTGAMGPAGIAADLESLSGRSTRSKNSHGGKSQRSSSVAGSRRRSSRKTGSRRHRSDRSVDSHGSRASRYSHRSTKSFLSQMSEQSRSVANDLLRLEMQLAMVGNNKDADGLPTAATATAASSNRISSGTSLGGTSRTSARSSRKSTGGMKRHASESSSVVRRSKSTIAAPPGKLGIILANKADSKGTVVSGVRTSSVLVDRISPGDRIIAIDGEDVSRMTVSEITTIMSRKAEYERRLTLLTASNGGPEVRSPTQTRASPRAATVGGGDFVGDAGYSLTGSSSSYRR